METSGEIDISNISITDLQSKYSALSTAYAELQLELERKSQQIHDNKRELTRLTTLESEYLNEIESLQSGERTECERLKLKINVLNEEKNDLQHAYSEQIERLEQDTRRRNEEIAKLQEELQLLSSINNSINSTNEIDMLQTKNTELKTRISELSNEMMELNEKIESYENQQLLNQEHTVNLQNQLKMLSENYECKKEELNEAKALIENLQEELILTKAELETAKSKPLQDGSQGNSLFAEVDDKRLELQDRMAAMKSHYEQMKLERCKLLDQIAKLNTKNAMLCQRWDTEMEDKANDEDRLEMAYRARIKLLETELEVCREEISTRQNIAATNLDSGEIEYMNNIIEAKNKAIEKIQKEVDSFSLSWMLLSRQLKDSNIEMRHWRAKATESESKIGKLQASIESLEMKKASESEPVDQLLINRCPTCLKKPKQSLTEQTLPNRLKFKDAVESLSRNSNLLMSQGRFSNVDCSRQLKKSLVRNSAAGFKDESAKENIGTTTVGGTSNSTSKKVLFTEDTVDNSDKNNGKLRKVGKIIHCKPVILKKKC